MENGAHSTTPPIREEKVSRMYADEIRAFVPHDEQEATDKRIILGILKITPIPFLPAKMKYAHMTKLRLRGERRRYQGAYGPPQYLQSLGLDRRTRRRRPGLSGRWPSGRLGRRPGLPISAPSPQRLSAWTSCPYGAM